LKPEPKRAGRVVADRIDAQILGRLVADVRAIPREVVIAGREDVGIVSRPDPVDRRQAQPDAARRSMLLANFGIFEHRGEVEHLADIGKTVPLAMIAVANERIGNGRIRPRIAGLIALERFQCSGTCVVAGKGDALAARLRISRSRPL